jgi:FKBP-type peptidyl-prolyl cis-trans isomerase SlyD
MTIDKNQVVTLHYTLNTVNENNEKNFVEQSNQDQPMTFLYGVGMMIPKFEEEINGLTAGDKKSFTIPAAEAYGERVENAFTQLPKEMFEQSGMPPIGAVLPLQDQNGNQVTATVVEVAPEVVTVDLNHPMAGKNLQFDIEVVESRPATEEELSHGHAHGIDGEQGH